MSYNVRYLSVRDMGAATVLVWAADNYHIDIVKILIAKGVSANARDSDGKGNSALQCAVWTVNVALVRLLIKHGADANVGNRHWTPLMTAAWAMGTSRGGGGKRKVLAILKLLLANGAKVNARDDVGQTALTLAAAVGNVASVRLLLRAGAYIHSRDKRGNGALIGAIQFHNFDTIKFLLEQGINPNARNKEGETVLAYAELCKDDDIVQLLLQHGARK